MKTIVYIFLLAVLTTASCAPEHKPGAEAPAAQDAGREAEINERTFRVEGMTCDHCEMSIAKGVGELNGVMLIEANHEDSTAHVAWDASKTGEKEIIAAIEKRGYKVILPQ